MKKYIIIILTLQAFCLNVGAQEKLKGRVVDAQTQEPLAGAVIKVKETNITAISNNDGEFELTLAKGKYQLSFQYLSYGSKELVVAIPFDKALLKIDLSANLNDLNEVQVIGYGTTTKRLSTGSISTLSSKDISSQPVSNILSAMSGRLAGITIQTTNGLPGGNINVQIRGKGSIAAGTSPLYIVDGVPFDGSSPNAFNSNISVNNIAGNISPLNNINPADIETITVLKDADATSIYGSRGSNGVVIINTKQVRKDGTAVDIGFKTGLSTAAQLPKILNLEQYLQMRKEAFANAGIIPSSNPTSSSYAPDLTVWSQTKSTDWIDYIFGGNAKLDELRISLGSKTTHNGFQINGNYRKEGTILSKDDVYDRAGITASYHFNKGKFNLTSSIQFSNQKSDYSNLSSSNTFLLAPNYPLYQADGSFNWFGGNNVLAEMNARSISQTSNLMNSLQLEQGLFSFLSLKVNLGYTQSIYKQMLKNPLIAQRPNAVNSVRHSNNSIKSLIIEPQLNFNHSISKHAFNGLLGLTFQDRKAQREFLQLSNFNVEQLMEDWGAGAIIDSKSNNETLYRYNAVFARLGYSYANKYILNTTVRRDGSSRFGPSNRFGTFYAIAGAWIWSDENFIKNTVPIISYGKLRLSIGTTGNDQIGDGQYLSTYSSTGSNLYQGQSALRPNRISNANFHWETTLKRDVAVDVGLFNDRMLFSANYYKNSSKDQLLEQALPLLTGFSSYQANIPAVVVNKGFEFTGQFNFLQKQAVKGSLNFNINWVKNKLQSFQGLENSTYANVYKIGTDISTVPGYNWLGINPSNGMSVYGDINGQNELAPYAYHQLGTINPQIYGGIGTQWSYRGISLSVFGQFSKQNGLGFALSTLPGAGMTNGFLAIQQRWSPANLTAKFPAARLNSNDINYKNSSANFFDTSYFRLKSVAISYNVPTDFLKKISVKNLSLSIEAQNLLTLWNNKLPMFDPESGNLSSGLSRNMMPLKSMVLATQIKF